MGAEPVRPGGGPSELGRPCGENPGITRRAIFSEGRGLRVRKCGPDASRGITYSWGANDGPVAKRKYARPSASVAGGRAEPAPPPGGLPELGWPSWESPEMMRKAVFSEGCALRVRGVRPNPNPG